jgi:hypothetical protein
MRRRGAFGSVVQIGLKRMNNGKDDYSVATFKKLYDFEGEQLANIKIFAGTFKEQIRQLNQRRSADAISRTDDDVPVYDGSEPRVNISNIDGDRDDLPA